MILRCHLILVSGRRAQCILDKFDPRYLSALGELNDTIYILGGYGRPSGEQILSPHAYNDLMSFSIRDHKFSKKFELKSSLEDFAFANCKALIILGRHTIASETYIKFAKEYKLLYGSDFEK